MTFLGGRVLHVNQQATVPLTLQGENEAHTWGIIPVSKWLITPIYKPFKGHLQGEQPYLGDNN